jgi:metal-sulfur cluster biosynthetic enzyme
MTLTSPHCPAAQSLPKEVEEKVKAIPGVTVVEVKVVWDPVWNTTMMSEAAKLTLGMQ